MHELDPVPALTPALTPASKFCPRLKKTAWVSLGVFAAVSQMAFGAFMGAVGLQALETCITVFGGPHGAHAWHVMKGPLWYMANGLGGFLGLGLGLVVLNFKYWWDAVWADFWERDNQARWVNFSITARVLSLFFHSLLWATLSLAPLLALKENHFDMKNPWNIFLGVLLGLGEFLVWGALMGDGVIGAPGQIKTLWNRQNKKALFEDFIKPTAVKWWLASSLCHVILQGCRLGAMGESGLELFLFNKIALIVIRCFLTAIAGFQTFFTSCMDHRPKALESPANLANSAFPVLAISRASDACAWKVFNQVIGFSVWASLVLANMTFVGEIFNNPMARAHMMLVGGWIAAFTVGPQARGFILRKITLGEDYLAGGVSTFWRSVVACYFALSCAQRPSQLPVDLIPATPGGGYRPVSSPSPSPASPPLTEEDGGRRRGSGSAITPVREVVGAGRLNFDALESDGLNQFSSVV